MTLAPHFNSAFSTLQKALHGALQHEAKEVLNLANEILNEAGAGEKSDTAIHIRELPGGFAIEGKTMPGAFQKSDSTANLHSAALIQAYETVRMQSAKRIGLSLSEIVSGGKKL